ncbi:MAG: hypothetical protein KAR20_11375, partial [Candidatus Heimdallarchaeota archaeon]|nr:hypothetical protein [Candidatus Heimdallarchaeota archaeon]
MRIIYENGVPESIDWQIQGPIEVGDCLLWVPLLPHEREFVLVIDKKTNEDGEEFARLRDSYGKTTLNSISSIRES